MPAQQKSSFLAITFEQNIGEIHESKTFEMSFDICWYLAFASQIDDVDVRARTDIQTHKTTTETLAAHARRGLKMVTGTSRCLRVCTGIITISISDHCQKFVNMYINVQYTKIFLLAMVNVFQEMSFLCK